MKIIVHELVGDASVFFYDEGGKLIYTEGFFGRVTSYYMRKVPTWVVEKFDSIKSIHSGKFKYEVV